MTKLKSSESARASGDRAALGRLFVLELSGNRVFSVNPDGSDRKVIVHECRMPDGIAVDVEGGHIYWTNMGVPNLNDGSIERADLDGRNRQTIVPPGRHVHAETAPARQAKRQAVLVRPRRDARHAREPRRVGDGNSRGDGPRRRPIAATRRGGASASPSMPGADTFTGRKKARTTRDWAASSAPISRLPAGQSASNRTDIEVLFDGLPEPIDLELDLKNRAPLLDRPRRPAARQHRQSRPNGCRRPTGRRARPRMSLITHLMEGIGIALDFEGGRMFLTDLAGSVYSARLDGSGKQTLLYAQGNLTGIAYA